MNAQTSSSAAPGVITTVEFSEPEPIKLPEFGAWPTFDAYNWMRNGREAGAYFAGVIACIPEKCAHVRVQDDWVAGATHAMIEGGLMIRAHAWREGHTTLEVRSAHHKFVE